MKLDASINKETIVQSLVPTAITAILIYKTAKNGAGYWALQCVFCVVHRE
jgi:hypothetical protein